MGGEDILFDAIADAQAATGPDPIPGTLYGADRIDRPDVVVWCDTPACARAIAEAGYPQTVALVPDRRRDLFRPLEAHAELIGRIGKIVLAGHDTAMLEELARRLGRHRAWRVRWPEGIQDACALMQQHRKADLRACIQAAEPYPIEGIHKPSARAMLEYRNEPPARTLTTGCSATDDIMAFPGEGKLIVVTGIPNMGKSTAVTFWMTHIAEHHHRRWAVFSPEFGDWRALAAAVLSCRANLPFRPGKHHEGMADAAVESHAEWAGKHFAFLACDSEDEAPTLEWLLERARACILRDGTTDLVIDPWNELEHHDEGRTETQYVGRCLQRLRAFAARHGCNVWIVAHPTKIQPVKRSDPMPVPTAYDINGGANWSNKSDMIVVVHTPNTVTQIHIAKSRFARWGRRGGMAELELDPTTGRYRSAGIAQALRDPSP